MWQCMYVHGSEWIAFKCESRDTFKEKPELQEFVRRHASKVNNGEMRLQFWRRIDASKTDHRHDTMYMYVSTSHNTVQINSLETNTTPPPKQTQLEYAYLQFRARHAICVCGGHESLNLASTYCSISTTSSF